MGSEQRKDSHDQRLHLRYLIHPANNLSRQHYAKPWSCTQQLTKVRSMPSGASIIVKKKTITTKHDEQLDCTVCSNAINHCVGKQSIQCGNVAPGG